MRQHRVGCGHKALGLVLGTTGETVRAKQDERGNRQRGIGLYTSELKTLASQMGGRLERIGVPTVFRKVRAFGRVQNTYQGPTVASFVEKLARECREDGIERNYIIHVTGHFIGASIGVRGHVAWAGANTGWMKRARVRNAYIVLRG